MNDVWWAFNSSKPFNDDFHPLLLFYLDRSIGCQWGYSLLSFKTVNRTIPVVVGSCPHEDNPFHFLSVEPNGGLPEEECRSAPSQPLLPRPRLFSTGFLNCLHQRELLPGVSIVGAGEAFRRQRVHLHPR